MSLVQGYSRRRTRLADSYPLSFHCLLCHGFEEFGVANAAVLADDSSAAAVDLVAYLAQLTRQTTTNVTILTNGRPDLEENSKIVAAKARGFNVDSREIKSFQSGGSAGSPLAVEFTDGSVARFGFVVHHPRTILRGPFAQQLGLEITSAGDILVWGMFQETSKRGVFAAGDCATPLKQVAIGMGAAVTAGIGANSQIVQEDIARW